MAGWWAAGISLVGGILGGSNSASAAKQQAQAQNAAVEAKYGYDLEKWDMDRFKLIQDRKHAVNIIEAKSRNESRNAMYADSMATDRYLRELQIRNQEQASLNSQFLKSDGLYYDKLTLNALTAQAAEQDELRKYRETYAESQYNSQDAYVDSLVAEGKMRSIGASGRTADKAVQASLADYGRQLAMMDESLEYAGRNTRAVLQEIIRDKTSADLSAWAEKMLHPGTVPMPIVPFKTPLAEFVMPRELGEYDFGPEPVRGAMASPSAASSMAWGQAIQGIAGGIAGGIASLPP